MMLPCRPLEVIKAARCFSWGWAPAWARRWSWMVLSNRWNWAICRSRKKPLKITSGLGTGLGSTMVVDGIVEPMELGHLPYKKKTFEDYVGVRGLAKHGKRKWRRYVSDVVRRLIAALEPDNVVLGGGNVKNLLQFPAGCEAGDNDNAFVGGFRF